MNRQQIIRRQIIAGVFALVALLIVVGIHEYLLTFDYQVRLGKLTSAQVASSSGTLPPWKDSATLAAIEAALPHHRPGPGFIPYEHVHTNMDLILTDDKGKTIHMQLPVTESELVSVGPPSLTPGNSWIDPPLLVVVAQYGLAQIEADKLNNATLKAQLEYWRDSFGGGKAGGGGK
jgi:hypothetical protein